jgi:predicted ATPase/class 3 adenylate cyclase
MIELSTKSIPHLPEGTVTFLFTDIEDSTKLWEQYPEEMKIALATHDSILKEAIETNQGQVVKTTGDGVHAVFATAMDAVKASLDAQREFLENSEFFAKRPDEGKNSAVSIRVRMGMHTGEAELRDDDYYGQTLNRAARIMSVAYGGQILLSAVSAALTREHLPENTSLLDLGEHRLKNLSRLENIFQLNAPGLPSDFPPLQSLNIVPNNLPTQLTSFIGREKEMSEITSMLDTSRLVTLTGSGGTGKTRLSIEIGTQELASFPNGVWLLELAPLTDPEQIVPALAQVLGLQELPSTPLTSLVIDYLRDKKALLILDNCEHLIEACARLADDLLHHCVGLKILASSREALGIRGEMAYSTPSLADAESTQLFMERACAANSNFRLTDKNASSVAQICSRLDGIPLAIELAAARTKLLSSEQIASRLDDRFRLLVGGSRTALPRQQTLRALIDWSYELLSDEEKALLRIASVFVSGWTLEAIEAISDDPNVLENLEQLVNKSLVLTEERESGMRFSMLETIRQYAREKLFDAKQVGAARDRHFFYFNDLSEKLWNAFRSSGISAWRDSAEDEAENLRIALEWGMENHLDEAIRLAANYCLVSDWFSNQRLGTTMVKSVIEKAQSLPTLEGKANVQRQTLLARAFFAQGLIELSGGYLPLSKQALQEAISISRAISEKRLLGYSLELLYTVSTFINDPAGEEAAYEGLHIFTEEINDSWGLGMAYQNMARIAVSKGDQDEKQKFLAKFNELRWEAPVSFQTGLFLLGLGRSEIEQGDYESARQLFEDAQDVFTQLRIKNYLLAGQSQLGHIARYLGDFAESKSIYRETILGWQDIGNRGAIAHELESFAAIAITEEEPQCALKLLGAAEALRERSNSPMTDFERIEYDQMVAHVRSLLDKTDAEALWAEGGSMSMEQAIELVLNE